MPYLRVETNVALSAERAHALAASVSALAVTQLGKPARWIMAHVVPGAHLQFGGSDAPAAFISVKSIGLREDWCGALSAALCAHLETQIGVPQDRTYIDFADVQRAWFGWDGKTFK